MSSSWRLLAWSMIARPTLPRRPWHGSRDADRPVPRAARRAQPGSPYVRPHDLLAPGGGGGDRLVRAAHLRRKGRPGTSDRGERAAGGVQAFRDEPRVARPPQREVAHCAAERVVQGWRHRRAWREGGRGRREGLTDTREEECARLLQHLAGDHEALDLLCALVDLRD